MEYCLIAFINNSDLDGDEIQVLIYYIQQRNKDFQCFFTEEEIEIIKCLKNIKDVFKLLLKHKIKFTTENNYDEICQLAQA